MEKQEKPEYSKFTLNDIQSFLNKYYESTGKWGDIYTGVWGHRIVRAMMALEVLELPLEEESRLKDLMWSDDQDNLVVAEEILRLKLKGNESK